MMRAVYIPGESPVHRLSAAAKLAFLAITAVIVAAGGVKALAVVAVIVVAAWYRARIGTRPLFQSLKPMALILIVIFLAQVWLRDASVAGLLVGKLAVLVAAAALVSATTKVSDMLDTQERGLAPLRPVGVNAEQIAFLTVLAIRFLPALFRIGAEVREAQRARGLEHSPVAAVVPMLIRALREGDEVAEALASRGWSPL